MAICANCGTYCGGPEGCDCTVSFLRAKLANTSDEYERVRQEQSMGGICRYCDCGAGHYSRCPLLNNGVVPEPQAIEQLLNSEDQDLLREMHISL